jgi:hypothetical protein
MLNTSNSSMGNQPIRIRTIPRRELDLERLARALVALAEARLSEQAERPPKGEREA